MCARKVRPEEAHIDTSLVRRLVDTQFPQWAGLPLTEVVSAGTSNAMYRLGEDMAVRLPRLAGSAQDVEKEHRWLPLLAGELPVAVPTPLGKGNPGEGYPWPWSVYGWLDGANPVPGRHPEPTLLAKDLAEFVSVLRRVDATGGPASYRSEPLAQRDEVTRSAIHELRAELHGDGATAVWESALRAHGWAGPAVWIHADLQPGNVLVADGRLSAVIDFGCLGLGDPAVDLIAAWYLLPAGAREVFRTGSGADDDAWARGRGWALSVALLELRHYRESNPVMASIARHVIAELLTDGTTSAAV
ncbi:MULTISPECIES: aminoglycoside phosphotransferase family protein [unclassified Streptomyces]|uniref:aminoglycoside phosphotransferase family protein n=1 Tax=unclassified Streptomyces TaxID=2593676 RepID=UPI0035E30DB0